MDATLNALHQAQFSWTDVLRRAQGDAFEALGLGPNECPYRVVALGSHWRLRDYTDHDASPCLLIVAAPIKRPYIWDLAPSVSAIRHCLRQRLHVFLLNGCRPRATAQATGSTSTQRPSANVLRKSGAGHKAFPHRSLTRRHAGSHIRCFGPWRPPRPRAPRSAPLFPAGDEPIPGHSRLIGSVDTVRNGPRTFGN